MGAGKPIKLANGGKNPEKELSNFVLGRQFVPNKDKIMQKFGPASKASETTPF